MILESPIQSRQYVLLTGATGLLGSYLMKDLFLQGCQLAVVVRPSKRMTVEQRIEAILQRWESELGQTLPRPIILTGDVCQPNLGLNAEEILWVRRHCGSIMHSAAVLQFTGASRSDEPWRTNVGGTQNVLQLAKLAEITEFHYVSTAYVCGKRESRVFENELDCQQEFRNDYERSKFESESLVRSADWLKSTTIYRPAVIVGDSQTGFTSTYHGLFLYLRLLATLVPLQRRNSKGVIETPIQLPLDGDEQRNLVPVDWVSQVISHLYCSPAAHDQTYHLSPDQGLTAREVLEYCYEYFNSTGVEFCGKGAQCRGGESEGNSQFAETFFENVSIYESYETSDPDFDKSNVNHWASHLPCPMIDKAMVLRFLEFGKLNRWGKQRDLIPVVDHWFESQLAGVAKSASKVLQNLTAHSVQPPAKFGLDVHGPGGGQWQLMAGSDGVFRIARGLPECDCPVLTLDDQQIRDLLAQSGQPTDDVSFGNLTTAAVWYDSLESVLAVSRVR